MMNSQVTLAVAATKVELLEVSNDQQYPWNISHLRVISDLVTDAASVRRLFNRLGDGYYTLSKEDLYSSLGVDQSQYEVLALLNDKI